MLVVLGWTLLTTLHASSPFQTVTQQLSRHADGAGSVLDGKTHDDDPYESAPRNSGRG